MIDFIRERELLVGRAASEHRIIRSAERSQYHLRERVDQSLKVESMTI